MASHKNGSKPSVQELRRERFWGKDGQPGWYDEIGRPPFSPAFFTTLEAVIDDERRSVYERSLAWWQLNAWGNGSTPAIEIETGRPLTMVECAGALDVDKSQVTRAFKEQRERNEMYTDERGAYCPVRNPKSDQEARASCIGTQLSNQESITYKVPLLTFINDVWKVENPQEAEEWSRAEQLKAQRAELKAEEDAIRGRLRPKQLNSFKRWCRAHSAENSCVPMQLVHAEEADVMVAEVRNESEDRYATVYIRKHYSTEESVVITEEVVSTKSSSSSLPDTEPTPTNLLQIVKDELPKAIAPRGSLTEQQTAEVVESLRTLPEPEKAAHYFFQNDLPNRLPRMRHVGAVPTLVREFAKSWPDLLKQISPRAPNEELVVTAEMVATAIYTIQDPESPPWLKEDAKHLLEAVSGTQAKAAGN